MVLLLLGISGTMDLVPGCLLCLLPGQQVITYSLYVNWSSRLNRALEDHVKEDLLGRRHVGPKGVDCRSRKRSSFVFLDLWMVLSVVFRVLTCVSMNLLDLGKWEYEVMWSM